MAVSLWHKKVRRTWLHLKEYGMIKEVGYL